MSNIPNDLLALDKAHLIHFGYPVGQGASIVIDRGQGVWLQDTNGKSYLDGRSQLNCVNLGYGHPHLVKAIQDQAEKLPFLSIFYQYTHPQAVTAAARLAGHLPTGLQHIAFTSDGSEANEMAMMIARLYWSRVKPTKTKIISRYSGYHGNTPGAMSATGMTMGGLAGIQSLMPGHIHIAPPYIYRSGETDPLAYAKSCVDQLAYTIEQHGPDTVAAFLAEPIIGVGGYLAPPEGYWPLIREVCDRYDVLLIIDEVMTGFCRTGRMFASELFGIAPDMLTMGKGINSAYIPCGAVGISDRLFKGIEGATLSGFTNSGHPIAMAATNAALDVYERDDIASQVRSVSAHVTERLQQEFMKLPIVGQIDGAGLMLGIEIVADKATKTPLPPEVMARITTRCVERGLITRGRGSRVAFCPPLIITKEESDTALDTLYSVLAGLLD